LADFASSFIAFEESLRAAAGNVMSKFDQMTFKMLINNLKSTDYQVVADTLDQLAKEKKTIAIPPVYFLSTNHPDKRLRERAAKALTALDPNGEALSLTEGKSTEEAVKALILQYGNFRG
jgi:hypothetical protein